MALPSRALTLTETTKGDFDSYGDSQAVMSRAYAGAVSISGELELSPIVQAETSGLGANPILSLAWQDNGDTLWAGGTSGAAPTVSSWRRTSTGEWQSRAATVASARSMALLATLGDTLYGGPANNLAGADNVGDLLAWNRATDTWELKRDLNLTDANFDGFSRSKGIWNNALYMSGGRTNSNTFLVFVDGTTGDVDFKSLENPPPTGGVATDYDGVAFGMVGYPVAATAGAERLFWGPLNVQGPPSLNGGNIARSREFGAFPVNVTRLEAGQTDMEVVGGARMQQTGIGDTLFILLEGGVAANNVIYTTTDGTNFTGKITKNALRYTGNFGVSGLGVTEAFAMRAFGRDIWIGGTLDTIVRYVGDYDTFIHLANTNMTSGIREYQTFRGLDGDTWMAIAGGSAGNGRIDRFRFEDSGTYFSDTKVLAIDTWIIADSAQVSAKVNGGTVTISFYFGRDTAELNARTFGETFTISGDTRGLFTFYFTKPDPSGRASGNAFKRMGYRVLLQTTNTLITPYFEAVDFNFHQDVTAPETVTLTAPIAGHDTNEIRPRFSWGTTADTVTGVLESGHDTFLLQIDTGTAGAFSAPHRFVLGPDSTFFVPPFNLGPDTRYLWRVLSYDTAGNVSFSESRVITIDSTAPIPPAAAISPSTFVDTTLTTITFRWSTGADSLSGVKQYILELESGVAANFTSPETFVIIAPDTFRVVGPLGISRADTYYWRVKAVDSATNESTSAIFAFRIRTPAILSLTDSLGVGRTSFTVLDTIALVLTDTDHNVNFGVADTIQVRVTSVMGLDTKTVVLTEDAVSSNRFRGSIALSDTTAVGFLLVGVGDSVTVTYSDSLPPFLPAELTETTAATVRAPSLGVTTFDSTAYRLDTRPFVTITDRDRNRNPHARDSVTVTLWNPSRNDTETLAFFETTDTSGIFTEDTISFSDTVGAIIGDSRLFVGVGDVIDAWYTDLFDAVDFSNDTATILRIFRASSIVAVDSTGVSIDSAAPGDTLGARISDPDANVNVVGRDTISITVRHLLTSETEIIVLRETTDTSGIFGPDTGAASSLVASDSASNNGALFVVLGKTVRFEYADAGDAVDSGTDAITILYRETTGTVDHTDSSRLSITSILRDSGVFVTVVDSDQNRNGTVAETVSVIVRALRSGDSETMTLTETGVTTGIFWNASMLKTIDTGAASVGNGILTVAPSHDTVVAEYADGGGLRTDTVFYVFSRSRVQFAFINKQGAVINQFTTGETVTARVIDPDQNATIASEGAQETVLITLTNTGRNDTETIVLFESTNLSGRFDSIVGLATSADPLDSVPNNDTLFAIAGDTITVRYADPSDAFDSVIMIVVSASTPSPSSSFLSDSIDGSIDTYFIADSFIYATVTDTDENLFPGSLDNIVATIICFGTGDSEIISLTEIGNDSSIFRNTSGLSISDTRGDLIGDGTLFAGRGDTILMQYIDVTDATDSSSDSAAIVGETTSSVTTFSAASYSIPDTAFLTIVDADHNANPQLVETFSVSVRSMTTLDTETMLMTETSETSGVFSGILALSNFVGTSPNDGTLLVSGSDAIVADYMDAINPTDTSFDTAGITLASTLSTMAILDSRQISVITLARGETFTVRVMDADANTSPLTAETMVIVLRNDRTGETENLTLTEISVASAIFLSTAGDTLSSSSADSGSNSGAIFALNGDSIRASYSQDSDSSTDTARVSSVSSSGIARLTDGSGVNRDTYSLSFDSVFIRLRDPDRNLIGIAVETVSISIQIPLTGDFETVTLTEASADTELFISSGIPIVDSAAVAGNNGVLVAGTSDTVLLSYTDVTNGDTSTDTASAVAYLRPSTARLINGSGADVLNYNLSDSVRIEVRDPNANTHPLAIDTVSVLLSNPQTGETEPVILTETSLFSGIFRFDSGLSVSSTSADSLSATGVIFALSSDSLIAVYTDAGDASDTAMDSVLITPAPSFSALRFTNATGVNLTAYSMDSFVYVTLADTDQNINGLAVETVAITVFDTATGDSETILLAELSVNNSAFRNTAGLPLSDTLGKNIGDGILFTGVVYAMTTRYQDAFMSTDSSTDTAGLTRASTISLTTLDRDSYAPETSVFITVRDADRNRDPLARDTLTVAMKNVRRNDTETVLLRETTDTSGIFVNDTGLRLSDTQGFAKEDSILLAALGDTFQASYRDAFEAGDASDTIGSVLALNTASTLSFNSDSYRVANTVLVTVIDRDKNLDPRGFDTITALVYNARVSDTESLVLYETDSASFTFRTSTLDLSDTAPSVPGDTILAVGTGDTITLRYTDPVFGGQQETTARILSTPSQAVITVNRITVTEGDTILVRVVDNDRNFDQLTAETIVLYEIRVRSPLGAIVDNEFGTVLLVETTETSGIFVSAPIQLSSAATLSTGDNTLVLGLSHTVEAEYRDTANGDAPVDTTLTTNWFSTVSSSTLDRDVYLIGHRVFGTVTDTDQNRKPVARDTVTITIRNLATGETETRIAYETADRSGTLTDTEGLLLTGSAADSVSGTGLMYVVTGDTIEMRYVDFFNGTDSSLDTAGINITPAPTASITFFTGSNGVSVSAYRMDSLVFVTVTDTDQNISGTLGETVAVDVFDSQTGDSEQILLSEIAVDTGIFRNTVGLRLSDTIGVSINDGLLFTGTIWSITARYVDPLTATDSSIDTATLLSTPTTSALLFDRPTYAMETFVFVTVRDTDRNRNPLAKDSVTITLINLARGDTETLTLQETTDTAGIFTNATGFRLSDTQGFAAGDAILLAAYGDTITARYVDAFVATDSQETAVRVLVVSTAETAAFDRASYSVLDSVVLTVVDRDKNLDPRAKDTVSVSVRSSVGGDSELLTLTETDSATFTFRSNQLVLTDTGPSIPGDGALRVATGETITLRYLDAVSGDTVETTAVITVKPTQGAITVTADTRTIVDTLQITVTDNDRNLNQSTAETIVLRRVQVKDLQGVVIEDNFDTFTMIETTDSSGIFSLATPLQLADTAFPVVAGDLTLSVGLGFTILIEYLDPIQADFASETIVIIDSPMASSAGFNQPRFAMADTAFATIIDRDENRHPLNRDTVTVIVRNVVTGETETRVLRETGEVSFTFTDDTGLFLSSLSADSASNSGRLYVRQADTIRVDYADANFAADTSIATAVIDTIPATIGVVDWINSTGATVSFYRPGDSVFAALTDTDRNLNPMIQETATLVLRAINSPDTEIVVLTEMGINSTVFRSSGLRLSDTIGLSANDGVLAAGFGDSIIADYDTNAVADTVFVNERVTVAVISFDSAAYSLDSTILLTVIDADENLNPYANDTLMITLTSRLGQDTETRVLTETTDTSGVFTITGIALSDTTGNVTNDSILMVGINETLTVSYSDTRGTAETVTATATTLRRSTASLLVLNLAAYVPTDTVSFTLTDIDRNRNPRGADTAAVSLRDFTTSDSETIVLLENSDTSGVFTGLLPLKKLGAPTNGDGILLVSVGDSILSNYIDIYEATDTAADTATIQAETSVSSLTLDRATYRAANRAVITVTDLDQNLNALANDTITVIVSTVETNDSETVILTETAAASGIFVNAGGLRLSDTVGAGINNGTLLIGDNDTFLVLYIDPDNGADTSADTATFQRTATQSIVTASRASLTDGDTLTIQIIDPDRNLNPIAAETIVLQNIFVLSPLGATVDNEFQTISLVETTETSGVFVSQPLTFHSSATPTSGDTILLIGFNHSIEADYQDVPNGDFDTVGVTITWFSTVSSAAMDRDIYVVGLRVYENITDSDQNRKPLEKDTVLITVSNATTGETERRIAYESMERSGVFTDTAGVLLSSNPIDSTSGSGILYIRTGDTLDVRYVDVFDGTDSSLDTASVNAAPPPTASVTTFVDSAGVSISAYRMDSLVYVTVIDTDKNLSGIFKESVAVDVFDAATTDSERITLTEIAPDTGVFRNTVGLKLSDTIGVSINDGLLFTGTILSITARYVDVLTATDSSIDTATLQSAPTTSSLLFDRSSYAPETFVFITVRDTDRNRNPLAKDSVTVTLINLARGDTETLTLLETTDTAGVFVNTTGFRISDTQGFSMGDAVLLAAYGDTITARYVDAFVATDSGETTARVLVANTPGTTAFDRVSYRMSDSVVLTVVDRDKNRDPRARDTVSVSVRNTRTGDSETLTLTETDSASMTFRANTFTLVETGAATPGDGRLRVGTNDTIVLRYADVVNGDTVETTALIAVTPSQATITVNDTLTLFNALSITVNDLDRNLNQYLSETIVLRKVESISPQGVIVENEFNTILLLETSETSGVFVLASPLRLADTGFPVVPLDRQMTAGLNFTIRVEYLDPIQLDFASDTGLVVDSPITSSGSFDKSSYGLAETAVVTIIDRDENRHPINRDTLVVVVRNVQTNEVETRVLHETGEVSFTFKDDTGLFLSSLSADSASGDGKLYVRISDTVRLEYSDPNSADTTFVSVMIDTIPATSATIDWTNIVGAAISFYRPGDSVFVSLTDTDQNLNPLLVDTVQIVIQSLLSADSEMILLTEFGVNSSLFRSAGLLLSDTLGTGPGDSILTAGFGDSVMALYIAESKADTVNVADNPTTAFVTLNFASYQLDTRVAATVADTDENRSPFVADTILVTFSSRLGQDTETIILTESTETSGIFTAIGVGMSDTTGVSINDGLLMAGAGDTITATYVDVFGTSETRTVTTITLRRSTPSTLTLNKDTYLSADVVGFTVVDTDRNRNPRIADSVAVTLSDPTTGDSEIIILTETSDTSRIFTGTIPVIRTGAPTNGDGSLLVQPGDTIQANYIDLFAATDTASDTARIVNQPTTASLVLDRDTYQAANRAIVMVTDLNANIQALAADTVRVVFRTYRTNDVETVVLTETAASSGIFMNGAGLRLSDTVGGASDGILFMGAGDTFLVTYIDAVDPSDSASDTAAFRQTLSPSTIDMTQAVYLPGDSIFIIVTDADRNLDPLGRDTVSITMVNRTRNDTEIITLRETLDTSGVFRNDTGVGFELVATPVLLDQKIQALLGDTLMAYYTDAQDALDQTSDNANVMLPTVIRHLFAQATVAGETTIVRVTALDANGDTIPGLEGLLPIVMLSVSGGTGNFLTTSESVINGFATFVYSKVEQTTLVAVFQISSETFLTTIMLPSSGTGARVISDQPTTGTIGSLIVNDGDFPAGTRFTVENRLALADSPSLITLIGIGATNLQNVPNLRTITTASDGTLLSEHRFRIFTSGGAEFTTLPSNVFVRISYPDADSNGVVDGTNVTENSLKIYRLDELAGRFELEPTSEVNATENFVTATVNHFTIFTIAGGAPVSGFASVNIYPNPFRPNAGQTHVTFDNIPSGTLIRIFTTDGHLVDEVTVPANSSTAQWDGRNAARRAVASGVYVYVLESQGGRKVGKIVVIR